MVKETLKKFKPGATSRTLLFTASLLWAVVGMGLINWGILFIMGSGLLIWAIIFALIAGTVKSTLILDKVARKNIDRISQVKGKMCIGGVYSIRMWLMVAAMVVLGRILRNSVIPTEIVGFLYVTVGWALFWSSRIIWIRWLDSE